MILSEHGIKHAEAIIKHCTDNGMAVEATMGLWNHLVRILSRLDTCEGRAARQVESAPTDNQQLQAKIRAIVNETIESQNGDVDAGELLTDLVADLRVLSAM
jgi:hypothetical protein